MKKRHLLLFCLLLTIPLCAYSVPAKPGLKKILKLADGTKVVAELVGDEYGHFWRASNGKAYNVVPGKEIYREVDAKKIMELAKERRSQANVHRVRRLAKRRTEKAVSYTGKKKGLIILVNFSDVSFKKKHTVDYYNRIANEKNFHDGDFKGSVYDYFYDQSIGASERFELNFDVVGPYTLSHEQEYYGKNINKEKGEDEHPAEMVIEALLLADANNVDFTKYDWDGDDEIEQVFILYAGNGEADSGIENTIWPHEYKLSYANTYKNDGEGAQTLDGKTIDTYACSSELNGYGNIAGIGTICHEFSHCLGYPDFYDTNTADDDKYKGQGMGYWDLMSSGNYNGGGYQPAGYTSYERWVAGWITPTELTHRVSVNGMRSLQENGESYIIRNRNHYDEYFLLENRTKTGWDASLPGFGLLIIHVDYDENAWNYNYVNIDPTHQRMTWMPADASYDDNGNGKFDREDMATDTYPQPNNNSFNKDSNPAALLHHPYSNGSINLESSIENITKNNDGTISFDYVLPNYLAVEVVKIENWNPVEEYIKGTIIKGSITLKNISDRNFKEKIKVGLLDFDVHTKRLLPINVDIEANEMKKYDISFSNLIIGHTYYVTLSYDNGMEFYRTKKMVCEEEEDDETIDGNETLTRFEYWFDDDFSTRHVKTLNSQKAVLTGGLSTDHLLNGHHFLHFRVQRDDGKWSGISTSPFLKLNQRSAEGRLDYWLDDDYATRVTLPLNLSEDEDEQLLTLDLSGCAVGVHQLCYQVTLPGSLPSAVQRTAVMKMPMGITPQLEYWFDDDVAHSHTLGGKASYAQDGYIFVNAIDMTNLSVGPHRVNFRATGSGGVKRSSVMTSYVMKMPVGKGNRLEYWYDDDEAHAAVLSGVSEDNCIVYDSQLNMSSLPVGLHRLNFRAVSNNGQLKSPPTTCYVMRNVIGSISRLEYWFDDDYDNVHTLSGHAAEAGEKGYIFVGELDISGLRPGHHRLHYRGVSSNGQLSTASGSASILVKLDVNGDATMASYSVSVDGDLVTEGTLAARPEVLFSYVLDASNLDVGVHALQTTFWNSYGSSVSETTYFQVPPKVATDVNTPQSADEDDAPIYNLSGMRVSGKAKGVFIKNGKKYVVK